MLRSLGAAFLVFASAPVLACAITVTEPLKYAFKKAPIVFEGTLEKMELDGTLHFAVHRQWKGAPVEKVVITNPPTSCAYHGLEQGERYVVVPESDLTIHGGSHVQWTFYSPSLARTLDRRARWWKCPLSSFIVGTFDERSRKIT